VRLQELTVLVSGDLVLTTVRLKTSTTKQQQQQQQNKTFY
jgi:hypothetical protein